MTVDPVENYLATKFEGKLFVHIYLLKIGNEYSINKEFYTVLKGACYLLDGRKTNPTGDKMINLEVDCKMVGKFNPDKSYKRWTRRYSYAQFKRIHML